jgi:hypothetical protein
MVSVIGLLIDRKYEMRYQHCRVIDIFEGILYSQLQRQCERDRAFQEEQHSRNDVLLGYLRRATALSTCAPLFYRLNLIGEY